MIPALFHIEKILIVLLIQSYYSDSARFASDRNLSIAS